MNLVENWFGALIKRCILTRRKCYKAILKIIFGKFECQKDIHFKTQAGPVAKNRTPRPPTGNWTRDPGSLDKLSTDWATEAVNLGASYVYIQVVIPVKYNGILRIIFGIISWLGRFLLFFKRLYFSYILKSRGGFDIQEGISGEMNSIELVIYAWFGNDLIKMRDVSAYIPTNEGCICIHPSSVLRWVYGHITE